MGHQFKFGDKVWHHLFKNGVIALVEDELTHVSFVLQDEHPFHCTFLNVPQKGSRDTSELHPVSDWIEIDWYDDNTLPESATTPVLAMFNNGMHVLEFRFLEEEDVQMITHWQPLPQPPK